MKENQSQSFLTNSAKMLIISDSHCYLKDNDIDKVIKKEKPSMLIHLGDLTDKAGDESDKRDHQTLMDILEENPSLSFIHTSGGEDSYGIFDLYVQNRKNSISRNYFKENEFIMMHELTPELKSKLRKETPHFILHGHNHRQSLAYFNCDSKFEELPIVKYNEALLILKPNSKINYFLNPGAFKNNEYCTLEKKGNFYSARFKSF